MKALALLLLLCATPAVAQPVAITNATVYRRPDQKLTEATVILRDGKIAAVGKGVAVPAGATVIDGRGKVVTAGLIDASTQLGLVAIELEAGANDGRFGNAPIDIYAAYRATDAYDPQAVAVGVARAGGVTSAIVTPTGGLVAGQALWASLAERPVAPIRAIAAIQAALGPGAVARASRGHAVERLRELFDDVDVYRRNRAAFERNQSRKLAANRLDLEALIPALEGRTLLVIAADAESDIRAALAIAAERRLRIAIAGAAEGWRVARELAAARVPVLVDPTANLPSRLAATDVRDDNATILAKAGVVVAITPLGDGAASRTVRQLAGIAVANGLPYELGLASITSAPATIFGGGRERGTLEPGSAGDVVVWSGDPLELTTRVETVIIGGQVQPLRNHQTRLLERYRKLN